MSLRGLVVTDNSPSSINTQLALIDGAIQNLTDTGKLAISSVIIPDEFAINSASLRSIFSEGVVGAASRTRLITFTDSGNNINTYLTSNAALNADNTWSLDDTTKVAWQIIQGGQTDAFLVRRAAAGANPISWTEVFAINSAGVIATGTWNGTKIGLAYGGTNADLHATGGANQFVKQSSAGGAFTVGAIGSGDVPDAALTSNVALLNRDAQNFTGTYNRFVQIGIGMVPVNILDITQNINSGALIQITNPNAGTASQANVITLSDSAQVALRSHALARTATRYGVTLGGYNEVHASAGNGLLIGTGTTATPIIFGTNSLERMRIDSAGNVGIGGTADASSALRVDSTTGAILIPRMTTTQKNALTAINGMIVYDSTLAKFQGYEAGAWTNFSLL